ncbi:hypothetical protein F511_01544 [Dorcoceras hygrometricum]|nr:hypothetical protein F511_01544 [Dorcoceras hygrometricum]
MLRDSNSHISQDRGRRKCARRSSSEALSQAEYGLDGGDEHILTNIRLHRVFRAISLRDLRCKIFSVILGDLIV